MDLWLDATGILTVVSAGVLSGRLFSRLRRPYWVCGYFCSIVLIAGLLAARCSTAIGFLPPLSWIAAGRARFIVLAWAITAGLLTPLSRLPRRCERYIVCILAGIFVAAFSVGPFLGPAFCRGRLAKAQTTIDADGVCLQSTTYTCGPAAAVTALGRLGFDAQEGEIAVLAHTSPVTGTLPRCLYLALKNRYGPQGLKCRYRRFDSVAQLDHPGITVAIVKDAFLMDHCVVVLDVSDSTVTLADPAFGELRMARRQFEKSWRFTGIVLERDLGPGA
jgi:predicted double-glycine peptidase